MSSSQKSTMNISKLEGLTSPSIKLSSAAIESKPLTENISKNIENIPKTNTPGLEEADEVTGNIGSVFWSIFRWSIIILLLAFLGFNIFAYLGLITGKTAEYLRPLLEYLGYPIIDTTKQTLEKSIEGTKKIVDVAEVGINSTLDTIENSLDGNKVDIMKSLNDAKNKIEKKNKTNEDNIENIPIPNDSDDILQKNSAKKSGFCYVGQDRGIRSCIEVGLNDTCMSGDIFPTREICLNPNLRY